MKNKIVVIVLGFFCFNLFASSNQNGIGLSFYLGQREETRLSEIVLSNLSRFEGVVSIRGKFKFPFAELARSSCRIHLWKPFDGAEKNDQNRIECDLDFKDYSRARMVLDLSQELISSVHSGVFAKSFPELKMQGPLSTVLAELFEKSDLQMLKGVTPTYYLGSFEETSAPVLGCSRSSENSSQCQLYFPALESVPLKVSLGENSHLLIQALCSYVDKSLLEGACPTQKIEPQFTECSYKGAWTPHGVWGAIDTTSKLSCDYLEKGENKNLSFTLGVTTVKPFGNRFSDPSVEVVGSRLKYLYWALKSFAQANENQRYIEYTLLPGRPPWSMEWVSFQRFESKTDLVSSMGCEERDVSTDSYYQTPVAEGANPFRIYTCSFHTYSLKLN